MTESDECPKCGKTVSKTLQIHGTCPYCGVPML